MADVFFWTMVVITVLFWIDLIIPDPIPFIDEILLFIAMVGGWFIYALFKIVTQGAELVGLITSPIAIIIIIAVVISALIWRFDLLNPLPKKKRK